MDFDKLNRILGYDKLSLEEKIRRAVRAAKLEMHPVWIEAMRKMPIHRKMSSANEMFIFARDLMYSQEKKAGHSEEEARRLGAQRMLKGNDW